MAVVDTPNAGSVNTSVVSALPMAWTTLPSSAGSAVPMSATSCVCTMASPIAPACL